MAMRIGRWIGAGVLAAVVAGAVVLRPDLAARTGAGVAAHNMCAAVFTAGLDPEATFHELVQPLVGKPFGDMLRYTVDRPGANVDTTLGHLVHARAHYTPGYGCRLEYPGSAPAPAPVTSAAAPASADAFAPATPVVTDNAEIAAAIEQVFAEHAAPKRVKAVVVVKEGRVIAERYAPGFGVDTPLLSYSVAKSFTNALLGVLVREGKLRADQPIGAPEWAGDDDPRGKLTFEDLLRMRSGLDAVENGTGFDPASWMLFVHDDMAGFAARHKLKRPPGAAWEYTSANTLIIDRALGQVVGGGASGMRAFAGREVFDPLGMTHVTMEFDGKGVFVGSAHVYAPARAFARFGLLYLNDGVAPDGTRILPDGWVAWSRRSTLGSGYGAGFWTNDGPSEDAAWRVAHGFPRDGFHASGNLGQRIYIIPSERLVITRFGYSTPPAFGMGDDVALIAAVIKATHGPPPVTSPSKGVH